MNVLRELMQGEQDAEKREVAKRRAVGMLLHDVLGDGTVTAKEVRLYVGGGEEDEVPAEDKVDLYYSLFKRIGYEPEMYKERGVVHIKLYGGEAKKFAREALPYLLALERMLEVVKSDEQIYSKVAKLTEMARAEKVKARVEGFTVGKRPRARLVVEADGAAAEYQIRLVKGSAVKLRFITTDRAEAERRIALLRAVGVRAEVKKECSRDVWYIDVSTNALAADSVHEEVRKAVVEFLKQCREAEALEEDAYRYLAGKFERGMPEWGEIRFSVKLTKDGTVVVQYRPSDPQSFNKAVNFLRELGMRDSCEGEWCFVHFTAREPEGGRPGHVYITADGLKYIGWLASRGDERAQWLKETLLKEAERKGVEVRERLEQYFREGEIWGSVKPPIEKEVEVEGKKVRVRVEEVEAWREKGEKKEHLVVRIRAKVVEGNSEVAVEKEAKFYKESGGRVYGYVNIHDNAEGGREADYARTAAVLEVLGIEEWSVTKERGKPKQIKLTGGALQKLMNLEPVCAALGICR
ncbi:PaRep2b protein [Pyrobaculum ferrireducens]|uniref:PaRep2b protein n=1 Tax=Pyrobaculum ferrireducens TaxID=1104324 RepID=UPI001F3E032A|nr:PaRep2b protein [Pyrobaculum ferrireducens]